MPTITCTPTATRDERNELHAQYIACSYLVQGCEKALFNLGLDAADPASTQVGIDQRAVDILQHILGSWRSTLGTLANLQLQHKWPDVSTLEGWLTVDPALFDAAALVAAQLSRFEDQS